MKNESPVATTRIMIVDDHPALCEGLTHRISAQSNLTVCGQAGDVGEALRQIPQLNPDVVIVDIALRSSDGLELIKAIRKRHKGIRALVHSMYDEKLYADRCLHAGAMGYVNKESDPSEVITALETILAGRVYLSPTMTSQMLGRARSGDELQDDPIDMLTDRQLEIFRLIGEGLTAQEIAEQLHISPHTVETHRENIKRKLGIPNVTQLTQRAVLFVSERT